MDNLATTKDPVMIIGATNQADALDSALRRAGRFDREISLGIPDDAARERIMRVRRPPGLIKCCLPLTASLDTGFDEKHEDIWRSRFSGYCEENSGFCRRRSFCIDQGKSSLCMALAMMRGIRTYLAVFRKPQLPQ